MSTVSEYFGCLSFDDTTMKERLPKDTYKSLKKTIDENRQLDLGVANIVANAMKDWAVEHGCTHYTHWFQPLTGVTAEKHDSFISPVGDGKIIMEKSLCAVSLTLPHSPPADSEPRLKQEATRHGTRLHTRS